MKSTIGLFLFLTVLSPSLSFAQSCGSSEIVDPDLVDWGDPVGALADEHYVGTMEIAQETLGA